MKKIRKGNDLTIVWRHFSRRQEVDGDKVVETTEAYNLEGKNLSLKAVTSSRKVPVTIISVEGNEITAIYYGKDQKYSGTYTIILVENEGAEGMFTIDANRAFTLVEENSQINDCDTDCDCRCGDGDNFEIYPVVELISTIKVGANGSGEGGGTEPTPPISYEMNDITFWNYDGTVAFSCTCAKAATLTSLPDIPSMNGLVGQAWTHTLEEVQAAGQRNGLLDVGAYYTTEDGTTHYIVNSEGGDTKIGRLKCTGTIDWGDGTTSPAQTSGSMVSHNYAVPGIYTVKVMGLTDIAENWNYSHEKTSTKAIYIGSPNVSISTGSWGGGLDFATIENNTQFTTISVGDIWESRNFLGTMIYKFSTEASATAKVVVDEGGRPVSGANIIATCGRYVKTDTSTEVTNITADIIDLTAYTTVPTLKSSSALTTTQIRVRKSLESAFKSATNWSNYADLIIGV